MNEPTPRQIMNHIRNYTRNPGCPFCRKYGNISRSEYKAWLKAQKEKEQKL